MTFHKTYTLDFTTEHMSTNITIILKDEFVGVELAGNKRVKGVKTITQTNLETGSSYTRNASMAIRGGKSVAASELKLQVNNFKFS